MHLDMVVGLTLIFFVVVVPILGLTARFALKPIVESLLALKESLGTDRTHSIGKDRILELEEEVASLRRSLRALEEGRSWEESLRMPSGAARPTLPGTETTGT